MVTIDMRSDTPGDSSPKLSMLEQRLAQHPKMQKKWKDSSNELRRQIEALFTPEQLATLKKIALQKLELQSLRNPRTLSELAATDQQKAELRRLHGENVDSVAGSSIHRGGTAETSHPAAARAVHPDVGA